MSLFNNIARPLTSNVIIRLHLEWLACGSLTTVNIVGIWIVGINQLKAAKFDTGRPASSVAPFRLGRRPSEQNRSSIIRVCCGKLVTFLFFHVASGQSGKHCCSLWWKWCHCCLFYFHDKLTISLGCLSWILFACERLPCRIAVSRDLLFAKQENAEALCSELHLRSHYVCYL